jgi:hypothetical protein
VHTPIRRASLALMLLAAGCGARDDAPGEPAAADSAPVDPARPVPEDTPPASIAQDRPATRVDTVMIEGMPETETSSLFTTPAGFALPFSAYVPEGLRTDVSPPTAVRFVAAFAGNVNRNAFMLVHVHDAGAAQPDATTVLESLADARSYTRHETRSIERPSWALDAIGFTAVGRDGVDVTGSIAVARHGDRYFHVLRHYPVEYGDGLPPRLHSILSTWRWEDDGTLLAGG